MVEYSASGMSSAFAGAIVKAQGLLEGAKKDVKNEFFKCRYADLASVWDACGAALQEAGIAVLQFPTAAPQGFVGLNTMLVYGPTGETLSEAFQMPVKDASNPQAVGSALTYARRYALSAIIGVSPAEDDGNAAAAAPKVNGAQRQANYASLGPVVSESLGTEFLTKFNLAGLQTGRDGMKAVYSEVKASALAEPAKTALLAKMAVTIKEMK